MLRGPKAIGISELTLVVIISTLNFELEKLQRKEFPYWTVNALWMRKIVAKHIICIIIAKKQLIICL